MVQVDVFIECILSQCRRGRRRLLWARREVKPAGLLVFVEAIVFIVTTRPARLAIRGWPSASIVECLALHPPRCRQGGV